jgi:hypothetical protein
MTDGAELTGPVIRRRFDGRDVVPLSNGPATLGNPVAPLLPGVADRVGGRDVAEHGGRPGEPVVFLAGPVDAVVGALLDLEPVLLCCCDHMPRRRQAVKPVAVKIAECGRGRPPSIASDGGQNSLLTGLAMRGRHPVSGAGSPHELRSTLGQR